MPWTYLPTALSALAAWSAATCIVCHILVWFVLFRRRNVTANTSSKPNPDSERVTVLRPMCGVDTALEQNLEALARQTHPDLEIVLGAADPHDPALTIALAFRERHPELSCQVVVGQIDTINPKVALLERMAARATGHWLVVSDSNVRVADDYVERALEHASPEVGLVTHLVAGVGGQSAAAHCENLQLNCAIAPGVCGARFLAGRTCVIGKSMFLRRKALREIGGFRSAGHYLAEDYAIGQKIEAAGYRVATVSEPVPAWHEGWTFRKFVNRHLRWAVMRRQVSRSSYLAEPLLLPVPLLTLHLAVATLMLGAPPAAWGIGGGLLLTQLTSAITYRCMAGRWPHLVCLMLNPIRETVSMFLWIAGWFVQRIEWRGKTYVVLRGSVLQPEAPVVEGVLDEA